MGLGTDVCQAPCRPGIPWSWGHSSSAHFAVDQEMLSGRTGIKPGQFDYQGHKAHFFPVSLSPPEQKGGVVTNVLTFAQVPQEERDRAPGLESRCYECAQALHCTPILSTEPAGPLSISSHPGLPEAVQDLIPIQAPQLRARERRRLRWAPPASSAQCQGTQGVQLVAFGVVL
jgi:hypothetical protein